MISQLRRTVSFVFETLSSLTKSSIETKTDNAFHAAIQNIPPNPETKHERPTNSTLPSLACEPPVQNSFPPPNGFNAATQSVFRAPVKAKRNYRELYGPALSEPPSKKSRKSVNLYQLVEDGNFAMAGDFLFWISNDKERANAITSIFTIIDKKSSPFENKLAFVDGLTNDKVRNQALKILFNLTMNSSLLNKDYLSRGLQISSFPKSEELKEQYLRELVITTYYNDFDIKLLNDLIKQRPFLKIPPSILETIEKLSDEISPEKVPDELIRLEILDYPKET